MDKGSHVHEGPAGFRSLFAEEVVSGRAECSRKSDHPDSVPTDLQAEVLIPGCVSLGYVDVVVLRSECVRDEDRPILYLWPARRTCLQLRVQWQMFSLEVQEEVRAGRVSKWPDWWE